MQTQKESRTGAAVALAVLLMVAGGAEARPPHQAQPAAKTTTLSGELRGTWRAGSPDTGTGGTYTLSGIGTVSPLGQVQAAGTLRGPGATRGAGMGTFTLTGPKGTMTLAISGTVQPALAASPSPVTFTVTGGTGAYAGDHGLGTALFSMTPQRRPAAIPGRMTPHFIVAAMFTLTFGSPTDAAGPAKG